MVIIRSGQKVVSIIVAATLEHHIRRKQAQVVT